MTSVLAPTIVTFISALFTLGGITGVTSEDISGFVNTVFAFITLLGIIWSYFAHKAKVNSLTGKP